MKRTFWTEFESEAPTTGIYATSRAIPPIGAIYLYYVPRRTDDRRLYCYWEENHPIHDVDGEIEKLIINAKTNRSMPPPCGQYLSDIKMRRVSVVVFVSDGKPLHKGAPLWIVKAYGGGDAGYTFSHAAYREFTVTIDGRDETFQAAVVVNSIRESNGTELDEWHDLFKIACRDDRGGNILVPDDKPFALIPWHDHESGGTNMGPPVPPP
jgi:hypothetical protein